MVCKRPGISQVGSAGQWAQSLPLQPWGCRHEHHDQHFPHMGSRDEAQVLMSAGKHFTNWDLPTPIRMRLLETVMAWAQLLQRTVLHIPGGVPCCETTTVWWGAAESHTTLKLGLKTIFWAKPIVWKRLLTREKNDSSWLLLVTFARWGQFCFPTP